METQKSGRKTNKRVIIAGVIALAAGLAAAVLYFTGILHGPVGADVSSSFTRTDSGTRRSPASSDVSAMATRQFFAGDVDGAVATLDQALAATPPGSQDRIFLLRDKGNIQVNAGRYDAAIGTYKLAVALDPDNAATREGLGAAYQGAGKKDEARAAYQKQLELAKKANLDIQVEDATRNLQELDG